MSRRLRHLVARSLLAFLAFAQGSLAIASCAMDRAELPRMLSGSIQHDCCDEGARNTMPVNGCVSQATSDLQVVGAPIVLAAVAPSAEPVLLVASPALRISLGRTAEAPPPRLVPPRILLHSFLI